MIDPIILSNQLSESQVEHDLPVVDCSRPVARGSNSGGPPDFDGDGNVGASDPLVLPVKWGPCP